MNYTIGEWIVKARRANRYWKAEVKTADIMDSEGKHAIEFGQLIAVFYGKNTVANAHLSSAAGAMYEALKECLQLIEDLMPGVAHIALQNYQRLNEAPIAARKAIAKAEGGEQG